MHQYTSVVQLESEDVLFFQVALQTNNTFASDVLLQVDSCWATESRHPDDAVQGVLLQDGFVETVLFTAQLDFKCLFKALFDTLFKQPVVRAIYLFNFQVVYLE